MHFTTVVLAPRFTHDDTHISIHTTHSPRIHPLCSYINKCVNCTCLDVCIFIHLISIFPTSQTHFTFDTPEIKKKSCHFPKKMKILRLTDYPLAERMSLYVPTSTSTDYQIVSSCNHTSLYIYILIFVISFLFVHLNLVTCSRLRLYHSELYTCPRFNKKNHACPPNSTPEATLLIYQTSHILLSFPLLYTHQCIHILYYLFSSLYVSHLSDMLCTALHKFTCVRNSSAIAHQCVPH